MALATYLNHLKDQNCSDAYISKQQRIISKFFPTSAQDKLNELANSCTQSTINDYYNRLRCYGAWLKENGYIDCYENITRPSANTISKNKAVFTRKEIKKLINSENISDHSKALWTILSHTGLRPVEASRVEPKHVVKHGKNWFLMLPACKQKSKRPDAIGLTEEEAKMIKKYCPLIKGDYKKLYRLLRSDIKKAGIPINQNGVARTPYNLRSFFITELLRNKVDIETVRVLARHSDIKTTLTHYARFNQEEIADTRKNLINLKEI